MRVGELVKVKVLSADGQRKRIALSIKEAGSGGAQKPERPRPEREKPAAGAGLDLSAMERAGFRVKRN